MENAFTPPERRPAPQTDVVALVTELAKKYWKIAAIALVALLALILIIPKGNSYKTPVKLQASMANAKSPDVMMDRTVKMLNGLGEDEMEDILKILRDTDAYSSAEDMLVLTIAGIKDNAGENYKMKMSVKDKEKVDKDDLEYMQERVDTLAERFADLAENMEENESDMVDELDLSSKDVKKLAKAYKKLAKIFEKAKVTKAYDLTVKTKVTGSQLDEAMKGETTMRVYKIGGRWVSESALSALYMFF